MDLRNFEAAYFETGNINRDFETGSFENYLFYTVLLYK